MLELPKRIEVQICSHCNSKLEEGKWSEENIPEEEIIYRALERNIKIADEVSNEIINLDNNNKQNNDNNNNIHINEIDRQKIIQLENETKIIKEENISAVAESKSSFKSKSFLFVRRP